MTLEIKKAISILKKGGIVIFPTDTAFGIGCRIDNKTVIKKLFALRKRPISQATPVLVNSKEMAKKYLRSPIPNNVRHLMEKYWPGGLTIIYPCNKKIVPDYVRGGGENLGVRMPNHKIALELINGAGVPILGPSANYHGDKTPYRYEDLNYKLIKSVDYVLKGECKENIASTVVNCSVKPWKIIRQGAVRV